MTQVVDGKCCRCNADCDGSFMRMDPRHSRVRHLLTSPDVPRFSGGGIALCHWCQRSVYWSKDFIKLLIKDLQNAEHDIRMHGGLRCNNAGGNYTYDPRNKVWDTIIREAATGKKVAEIAEIAGCQETTVYDVMRKHNLPTPTQIRQEAKRLLSLEAFGADRAKKVRDMRLGGQSWNSIAAKLGEKREHVMAAHINLTGGL